MLNYTDAGVNINLGNEFVKKIVPLAKLTNRVGVLEGIGGFSGLFKLPKTAYTTPVLVSSTDGVGTKIKLAPLNTVGIDLVAMCVNDIITCGAEPLFFLDYYATGKLNIADAEQVIRGIVEGCQLAGCALIGGETAEMPGTYATNDYDLAGFAVGIVEKSAILHKYKVTSGDVLIALASSGPHSNGYSLIRKILETNNELNKFIADLVAPTRIYVKSILKLLHVIDVHAIAHITGGGITENLPRILPPNTQAKIDCSTWQWPEVFKQIQAIGNITDAEMLRVFNCGVGMIIALPKSKADIAISQLNSIGEQAWIIGQVQTAMGIPTVVYTN